MVSFSDQPISLANAFEAPVTRNSKGGFLKPSIKTLADYWLRVQKAYGLDDTARAFALDGEVKLGDQNALDSLQQLENWIDQDGKD